jgi:Family of unknown function (DUF6338)
MSTNDIPVILLLLLPGFVSVQVFNLVSRKRRLSDFEMLLWILMASFALLAPTMAVWHAIDNSHASLAAVVTNPSQLPLRVAGFLYLLAIPLGWLVGIIDRNDVLLEKGPWNVLKFFKVDPKRRHDVWHLVFRDAYYVIVHLKSGEVIWGYPEINTSTRDGAACELYLTGVADWSEGTEEWIDRQGMEGVWIDAPSINQIEFVSRPINK